VAQGIAFNVGKTLEQFSRVLHPLDIKHNRSQCAAGGFVPLPPPPPSMVCFT
jgi:hypothetical protein